MPKPQRHLAAIVGLCAILFVLYTPAQADNTKLTGDTVIDVPVLVNLLNQDRAKAGLPPLRRDAILDQAAALKAADMARNNYFAHTSPQGATPWQWFDQAAYDYQYAGENLALEFKNPEAVQQAWMASPKHRENILNPDYEEVGYAIVYGSFKESGSNRLRTGYVIVQLFGKKAAPTNIAEALSSPAVVAGKAIQKTSDVTLEGLVAVNDFVRNMTIAHTGVVQSSPDTLRENTNAISTSPIPTQSVITTAQQEPVTTWPTLGVAAVILVLGIGLHGKFIV